MKKFIKKTAISLIFSFSTVFVFTPAFAGHRSFNRCCRTSNRFGNGGEWVVKENESSKKTGYLVFGGLGLAALIVGTIIWFTKKDSNSNQEPQKIYVYPKKDNQEYGKKFNYNPSHEEINPSEASDEVIIMEESNENFKNNSENNNEQNDPSLIIGDRF